MRHDITISSSSELSSFNRILLKMMMIFRDFFDHVWSTFNHHLMLLFPDSNHRLEDLLLSWKKDRNRVSGCHVKKSSSSGCLVVQRISSNIREEHYYMQHYITSLNIFSMIWRDKRYEWTFDVINSIVCWSSWCCFCLLFCDLMLNFTNVGCGEWRWWDVSESCWWEACMQHSSLSLSLFSSVSLPQKHNTKSIHLLMSS